NAVSVGSPRQASNLAAIEGQLLGFASVDGLHIEIGGAGRSRSPSHKRQSIALRRERCVAVRFVAASRPCHPTLLSRFYGDEIDPVRFTGGRRIDHGDLLAVRRPRWS